MPNGPPPSAHPATLFLCICDRTYPRLLAFSFLLELSKGFLADAAPDELRAAVRPYAFIRFESQIQQAKRRYMNTRSLRTADNLAELSASLQGVETWRAEDAFGAEYAPPRSAPALPKLNLNISALAPPSGGNGVPLLFDNMAWRYTIFVFGAIIGLADWWYGSRLLHYLLSGHPLAEIGVSIL